MITADIICRTFRIQLGQASGTGFTLEVNGKLYLVTAKHILPEATGTVDLEIFHNATWKPFPCDLVGHSSEVDITVLAPFAQIPGGKEYKVNPSSKSMIYGQDLYFLGFPLGLYGDHPKAMNDYPLPFVKKGALSMLGNNDMPNFILDGINNLGFSGGPVVFQSSNDPVWRIAGVISGYLSTQQPVYVGGSATPFSHQENTGLISVAPIEFAIKLIEANPIGFQLP